MCLSMTAQTAIVVSEATTHERASESTFGADSPGLFLNNRCHTGLIPVRRGELPVSARDFFPVLSHSRNSKRCWLDVLKRRYENTV